MQEVHGLRRGGGVVFAEIAQELEELAVVAFEVFQDGGRRPVVHHPRVLKRLVGRDLQDVLARAVRVAVSGELVDVVVEGAGSCSVPQQQWD